MTPDALLGMVAAFAGFTLKTTLAFGVCWLLSRLAGSPNRRFLIWLSFLYGVATYWLWLANGFRTSAHLSVTGAGVSTHRTVASTLDAFDTFRIPNSWALPLGFAVRGLGIAYLVVLIFMVFTHVKRQRQLNWVKRFTSQPPAVIAQAFRQLAEDMHVSRSRLLVLSGITSPATFGWIQPTVLLPDVCLKQDQSELEDILRHELHHVRRRDFIWDGVAVGCRALLFFHPATWYAVRRIQFERELACDLAVVSDSPQRRVRYAESLVQFARSNLMQSGTWGIDFAAPSEHLNVRVKSILASSRRIPAWSVCVRVVCATVVLVGFVGAAPSLVILLSYSQRPIVQSLTTSANVTIRPVPEITRRPRRKERFSKSPQSLNGQTIPSISNTQDEPVTAPAEDVKNDSPSALQSGPGPHLLRRGAVNSAPANRPASQQTIALSDPEGDQTKSGDHDKKQALQQSATAAVGIYKRLSGADRH